MAKKLPIRPVISKKPRKNIYDYWDVDQQVWIKCSGFDIYLWDSLTQSLVKRRVKADFESAKIAHQDMIQVREKGALSLPTYVKRQSVITIWDLYKKYAKAKSEPSLRNRQTRSPLTIERTRAAVNAFSITLDDNPQISQITPSKIEGYIKRRLDTNHTHGGINVDLRTLKALFSWGVKKDYLTSNPFLKVDMFKVEPSAPRPLTQEEVARLYAVCPKGSRWYPLIIVYLLTGARLSEVLKPKLSWKDIDLEQGTLTLPVRKGRKSSEFQIKTELIGVFQYLKDHPYTKVNSSDPTDSDYPFPFNASYISHKIKAILNEAGIDATAHDLRDSFVSHLVYLGYSMEDVSEAAGHSSITVTEKHYYKQLDERKGRMASDLQDHIIESQSRSKTDGASKTGKENG